MNYNKNKINDIEVKDSIRNTFKSNKDKHPVFIILSYTNTTFGKGIRTFTGGTYTHAALSLDSKMDKLYSFNANNNKNKNGGFSIESFKGYLNTWKDAIVCIFTIFVNKDNLRKIKDRLEYFMNNVEKTKYSFINIFTMLLNKPLELSNSMICSQFVSKMFEIIGVEISDKKSNSLVSPDDIYKSNKTYMFKVYEGRIDKYKKSIVDNQIKKFKDSNTFINVVEEGSFYFIEDTVYEIREDIKYLTESLMDNILNNYK